MLYWFLLASLANAEQPTLRATATVTPAELVIPIPARLGGKPLADEAVEACVDGAIPQSGPGLGHAVLELTPDALQFGGRAVTTLANGSVAAADLTGNLVSPLHAALASSVDALKSLAARGCVLPTWDGQTGRVLIAADGTVPYGTLRSVLYTLGQAQFGRYDLRVDGPVVAQESGELRAIDSGNARTVAIDGRGFQTWIGTEESMLPCDGGNCANEDALDFAGLQALLVASQDRPPGVVVVVPHGSVPWSTVLRTLDVVSTGPDDQPLFPNPVLAGAVAGGKASSSEHKATWRGRPGSPSPVLPETGATVLSTQLPAIGKPGQGREEVILGSLDRGLIDEVIRKDMSEIRRCYQQQLSANPELAGILKVAFVIQVDGTTSHVAAAQDTIEVPEFSACMLQRFEQMVFPEPKGGGIVRVTYPFVFKPQ